MTKYWALIALSAVIGCTDSKDDTGADTAADTDTDTDSDTDTDTDADADLYAEAVWSDANTLEITISGGTAGYDVGLAGAGWAGEACGDGSTEQEYGYSYCHYLGAEGTLTLTYVGEGAGADDIVESSTTLYHESIDPNIAIWDMGGSVVCMDSLSTEPDAGTAAEYWADCE